MHVRLLCLGLADRSSRRTARPIDDVYLPVFPSQRDVSTAWQHRRGGN